MVECGAKIGGITSKRAEGGQSEFTDRITPPSSFGHSFPIKDLADCNRHLTAGDRKGSIRRGQ